MSVGQDSSEITEEVENSVNTDLEPASVDSAVLEREDEAFLLHNQPINAQFPPHSAHACGLQLREGLDWAMVSVQIPIVVFISASVAIFMRAREASRGQCLLGAQLEPGGVLIYTSDRYWCDVSFFGYLLGGAILIGMISVNWIAQLQNHPRWLKAQLAVTFLGFALSSTGVILLFMGFMYWCEHLQVSVHCTTYDEKCIRTYNNISSLLGCHHAVKTFDQNYYMYDKLMPEYFSAFHQIIFAGIATIMWLALVIMSAFKKKTGVQRYKASRTGLMGPLVEQQ